MNEAAAAGSLIAGAKGFAQGITPAQKSQVDQLFSMTRSISADLGSSKLKLDKMNAQRSILPGDFVADLDRLTGNQTAIATAYGEIVKGLNLLAQRLGLQQPQLSFAVFEIVIGATLLAALLSVLWPYIHSVNTQADAHKLEVDTKAKAFDALVAGKISPADYASTGTVTAQDWKVFASKALPYVAAAVAGIFLINNVIRPYMERPAPRKTTRRKKK